MQCKSSILPTVQDDDDDNRIIHSKLPLYITLRPPTAEVFEAANPLHMEFIKSVANLRAVMYGITGKRLLSLRNVNSNCNFNNSNVHNNVCNVNNNTNNNNNSKCNNSK